MYGIELFLPLCVWRGGVGVDIGYLLMCCPVNFVPSICVGIAQFSGLLCDYLAYNTAVK